MSELEIGGGLDPETGMLRMWIRRRGDPLEEFLRILEQARKKKSEQESEDHPEEKPP